MTTLKRAAPDRPIHELIAQRWSPYALAERPVPESDLRSLFEAARWAASSYNEQPWSYLVATKANPAAFQRLLSCLVEGNQAWAKAAPVLAIGCTRLHFLRDGKPNAAAVHDLGLASATLTLEATARGLFVHQMIGIVPDKVRELYRVPDGVQPFFHPSPDKEVGDDDQLSSGPGLSVHDSVGAHLTGADLPCAKAWSQALKRA